MNIDQKFLTPNKYSRPQTKIGTIKGVVVHWVANPGSTAIANRNYFEGLKNQTKTFASSHYIIGLQGEVVQCIPLSEVAYHANNANSTHIGIECCHPDWDGKFNTDTYATLVNLLTDLCLVYKLDPLKDIVRHYDVTGKDCPRWYVKNSADWQKLKEDVKVKISGSTVKEEESDVLKFDKEWQWEQLVKQLQELREAGIITSDEWIMKAKAKRLTVSELAFVNNTVLSRIALNKI